MQTSITHQSLDLDELLGILIAKHLQNDNQLAIWRFPKSNVLHVLIDDSKIIKRVPLDLEELPAGFIVHPFEDQEDQKAYFLEAHTYFTIQLDIPLSDQEIPFLLENTDPLPLRVHEIIRKSFTPLDRNGPCQQEIAYTKEDFIELVLQGIEAIQTGKLHKIVPAKLKRLPLSKDFNLIHSMHRLLESYPNAFINFFHIPGIGTWIGASPETLIQTKGKEFFTMSLAGTQKAYGDNPIKNAAWTQKEIEEQALVSRYIVDCFKKIRLREYTEQGPKTVVAGNLLHLRSDFKVDMEATNFPQLGSVMLKLLHPTSAVCGMPRKEAFEFLSTHERFNRSLFAGFIGPVNMDGETRIFVNLRTARLLEKEALLYAGAGVTEDSNPEKEWEETEMKCDIIGNFLKSPKD
ncbi:chorismate-binding protein [Mongoliitalea daihaiensis]|uniref:chorismate-binding protein n=1 Tax=Mongoliitalea daihaiensis TaxID=2782006 RepID=UPI001F377D08|nr:chorismate-binding protein [Mongoliitalea daihaiensis]UJP63238.1 chorismate-binding protein [Mongoliitalea daihaiensis]